MRPTPVPRRRLRAALTSTVAAAALLAATVAPVAAAEPGPTSGPALAGFVTDVCTGLPITDGLTVGLSLIDPVTGQAGPPVAPPTPPVNGFFSYPSRTTPLDGADEGQHKLVVSDGGGRGGPYYIVGSSFGGPPGPLPPGQSASTGILLDIRLMPVNPPNPCQRPAPPLFHAIIGRVVDAATGRGLTGLTVGLAPLVVDPTTGMVNPGPMQMPSSGPFRGLFVFRDPGPIAYGFQFYASAPGHASLGGGTPGIAGGSPGVKVTQDPGPISLPAGTGSVNVSLVLSIALPAVQ